jgi:hypothetical protein
MKQGRIDKIVGEVIKAIGNVWIVVAVVVAVLWLAGVI